MLKSNGLRLSKNLPAKFGFSPKPIPTNIAKKLPPQRCSKPFLIPIFNTSGTNGPRSLSRVKVGTHSPFGEESHTADHRAKQEPSLSRPQCGLCCQRNFFYSATLLYTYISRFFVNPQHQQMRKIWQSCCHKFYPQTAFHRVFQLLAQTAHVRFHERKGVHTRLSEKNRTQGHTRRNTGPSLLRPQHGFVLSAKFLLFRHAFIYIHFPVLCDHPLSATALPQTIFHRVFQPLAQTAHVRFRG